MAAPTSSAHPTPHPSKVCSGAGPTPRFIASASIGTYMARTHAAHSVPQSARRWSVVAAPAQGARQGARLRVGVTYFFFVTAGLSLLATGPSPSTPSTGRCATDQEKSLSPRAGGAHNGGGTGGGNRRQCTARDGGSLPSVAASRLLQSGTQFLRPAHPHSRQWLTCWQAPSHTFGVVAVPGRRLQRGLGDVAVDVLRPRAPVVPVSAAPTAAGRGFDQGVGVLVVHAVVRRGRRGATA